MTKYHTGGRRRPHEIALLVVAVAAAGFNLRTAITSVPPLFPDMQTTLHLSSATLSLLAATPVICFGVVSAFAAWLNRRYGEEMNLLVALILLTAGLLLRGLLPRTGRTAHRHLPDHAVRGRDPVLAAQRPAVPQLG